MTAAVTERFDIGAKRLDYLTDGRRLVMVRRVLRDGGMVVEEADTDPEAPHLTALSERAITSGRWRLVPMEPLPEEPDA
jgi:hypothetical protein